MKCLHIITPVKDSIDSTLETVKAIMESDILVPFTYTAVSYTHLTLPTIA